MGQRLVSTMIRQMLGGLRKIIEGRLVRRSRRKCGTSSVATDEYEIAEFAGKGMLKDEGE